MQLRLLSVVPRYHPPISTSGPRSVVLFACCPTSVGTVQADSFLLYTGGIIFFSAGWGLTVWMEVAKKG